MDKKNPDGTGILFNLSITYPKSKVKISIKFDEFRLNFKKVYTDFMKVVIFW